MSEQEIIEGNRLIAEFVDYEKESFEDEPIRYYVHNHLICTEDINPWESSSEDWNSWLTTEEMKFHSSWDWLMPVVEKIEKTGHMVNICEDRCSIDVEIDEFGTTKIEAVWLAVVEFIKWYNQKK